MLKRLQNIFIVLALLFVAGCSNSSSFKEGTLSLIKTTNPAPGHIQEGGTSNHVIAIKKDVASFNEIYDVAVIKGKKETLVAYKVKHMHRFRMKQIEKKMNKLLEKKYPKENFIVSSDYKIFLEAVQLIENMKKTDYPKKKAEKRLEEIISLKKELT